MTSLISMPGTNSNRCVLFGGVGGLMDPSGTHADSDEFCGLQAVCLSCLAVLASVRRTQEKLQRKQQTLAPRPLKGRGFSAVAAYAQERGVSPFSRPLVWLMGCVPV